MKRRVKLIAIFFLIVIVVLVSRLYFLAIKSNTYYDRLALNNIIKKEYYSATRGEIIDRNGIKMAINRLGFSIYLNPHLKEQKLGKLLSIITKEIPSLKREKLKKIYTNQNSPYNHKAIKIVNFIAYDDLISKLVLLQESRDIIIKPTTKRFYPQGETMAHIIGYIAKANRKELNSSKVTRLTKMVGKSGIERYYNSALEGSLGERYIKVTALNKPIKILSDIKPKSYNLTLTVDTKLQSYLSSLFEDKSGAIVVMDVKDGSILAAGSYPEYDNNEFIEGISNEEWQKMIKDLNHPFTNKFIHGLYPPGSATKPLVLLSFLRSGLLSKDEKLLCEGSIKVGKRKFRCWNKYGHGEVDGKRAIKESCDVYFYKGGLRVGIDKISTDLFRYGFGEKCGIDMPNEFIGTVPNRNWKIEKFGESWHKGETLNTVIGQGNFLATPLQIATATALIATGKKPIPHFLKAVDDQNISFGSELVLEKDELNYLPYIREGMYTVCNEPHGTAYKYMDTNLTVAGKTGTSQVVGIPQDELERMSEDDLKYYKKSHAWFTTYAPYEDPKYVVTVIIEHGGHGGKAAGKLVSQVYNKLVELGYIDKGYLKTVFQK